MGSVGRAGGYAPNRVRRCSDAADREGYNRRRARDVDGAGASHSRCSFFFSSRRRHTIFDCDWSSDVCSSDLRRFFPFTLHISGPLLEWLEAHDAGYLDLIGRLATDGHVELLLAGFYEPVLASLVPADRIEQVAWMREAIQRRFGVQATGLWLTERVWEPDLAAHLADAGVRYVVLDDRHFLVSGFERDQLHAPFFTESGGKRGALVPLDEPRA